MDFRRGSRLSKGWPGAGQRRGFPSLRLAALLAGLMAVIAAMARLEQPATQRAMAAALSQPVSLTNSTPLGEPLLDADSLAAIEDNAPFRDVEQPAWFAAFRTVNETPPPAAVPVVGYAALASQPDAYRGRAVQVAGRVMRVERVTPAENDDGLDAVWRVTLAPEGGEVWPITVYTIEEPRAVDEPYAAHATGLFFKNLSYRWAEGVGVTPVIVAKELADGIARQLAEAPPAVAAQPEREFDLPDKGSLGRALLADLSFDLTALDGLRDRSKLRPEETDAFYGLLEAVAATPPAQLARLANAGLEAFAAEQRAAEDAPLRERQVAQAVELERRRGRYSVAPLFGEGADVRGELLVFDAVVRRVVRIEAGDSDAAAAAGVDHYFELEAFTEDSQGLPIVFCVRELPAGFPIGDAIRRPARLAGFFFKQWAYRTRKRSADAPGVDARQFAPLLIGRAPIPLRLPEPTAARPAPIVGVATSLGLLALVVALVVIGRQDRRFRAGPLARARGDATRAIDSDRLNELAGVDGRADAPRDVP